MEKKRFQKPVAVPIKKWFCIYCVLEIMLQNAEIYRIHFNAFEGRFISGGGGAYDRMLVYNYTQCIDLFHISRMYDISKIQLVVYYQCCCQIQLVVYYQCCVQIG